MCGCECAYLRVAGAALRVVVRVALLRAGAAHLQVAHALRVGARRHVVVAVVGVGEGLHGPLDGRGVRSGELLAVGHSEEAVGGRQLRGAKEREALEE